MSEHQVDCIVRFHDSRRLYELNRCIFSLVGQTYRPLNIILVTQRFTAKELDETRASLQAVLSLPNAPTLSMVNWEASEPRDARTALLNMGLQAAKGRYVAFLDYDDVLYPEAYSLLVERLRSSSAAIAFASVRVVQASVFPQFIQVAALAKPLFGGAGLSDLFKSNFCPIHSYLIDRQLVSKDILSFDMSLTWEEDYDLLLRICAAYPSDFDALKIQVGDYYYKNDGSNSVPTNGGVGEARLAEYAQVVATMERRRKTVSVSHAVQKQLGFSVLRDDVTISSVLNENHA